ncbi:Metalloendopeptidase, partial [Meloidogyne graminicola]
VQFNALKNRQLTWHNGIIPYELDEAFCNIKFKLLKIFYLSRRTFGCIRFKPRHFESDYLNIVRGNGCYSQVGKTGGKQELSLGQGCLFNETVIHELMHSLGFWHEHSREDRDNHIIIRWENILPGLDSQFDVVSSAIQDTLDEPYDYKSIMHYGSSAFSRNGRNTLEAVIDEFTNIIGNTFELSELDVAKIMKLYRCKQKS